MGRGEKRKSMLYLGNNYLIKWGNLTTYMW